MKYLKYGSIASVILIVGMYVWYLLATEINKHADVAATVIIQDTLTSNNIYNTKKLKEIKRLLEKGEIDKASLLVDEEIDSNLSQLEGCVTDKCTEVNKALMKNTYNKMLK